MSFAHLATIGTLSYNGYAFDGASGVKVNVEFVKDDAERTIVYSQHTIEVHTFVSDSASTDGQLENIRARLNHPGQAFIFVNKGFGDDLIVNANGGAGVRDVKWGPMPEMLYWEPVGSAGACEVIWKVVVCVPCCGNGLSDRTAGVMAFNFGVDIAIDIRGLSTRTIDGYIEIAQTRGAGKTVPDCADNYRFMIQPDLPNGFQREQHWAISPSKSRVTFTITDRQLPTKNPYPQLVTNIRGNHRTAWRRGPQAAFLLNSISLDIELALGAPQALAYKLFGGLIKARVDYAARQGLIAFLDEVAADEEIFGLGYSFGCSYRLLTDIGSVLAQSTGDVANANPSISANTYDFSRTGQWQPVGTDWRLWRGSLSHVSGERGLAGLTVPAQNDVIVDLCDAGLTVSTSSTQQPNIIPVQVTVPTVRNIKPPPRQSYLSYRQRAVIRHQKYVARQKPMQAGQKPKAVGDMMAPDRADFSIGAASSSITPFPDVLQESGAGSFQVAYIGSAERVGYEIPRPNIQSVGGQTPVEVESIFDMEQTGVTFGVPVFRANWYIVYELPGAPGQASGPPKLQA